MSIHASWNLGSSLIGPLITRKNIIRLRSILNGQVNLGKNTSVLESLITEIRTCKNFIRLRSILIRQVNLGKNTSVLRVLNHL